MNRRNALTMRLNGARAQIGFTDPAIDRAVAAVEAAAIDLAALPAHEARVESGRDGAAIANEIKREKARAWHETARALDQGGDNLSERARSILRRWPNRDAPPKPSARMLRRFLARK